MKEIDQIILNRPQHIDVGKSSGSRCSFPKKMRGERVKTSFTLSFDKTANDSKALVDSWYARYVLLVLVIVYIFNFIDRQLLAILAEDIKADLGILDADIGFLFGTAFAVFYATFGIALGRLADVWNRKKLISLGVGFWSIMTALSGLAQGVASLALCRFGVGVGESSASPAAYSLLYDYFSPRIRTTVLAVYNAGVYIGAGLGIFLGGWILDGWNGVFPDTSLAPFGLKGWQVAFMVVGLPGLIVAIWVSTLREPVRGVGDGITSKPSCNPFHEAIVVLMSMLPVCNLWVFANAGSGYKTLATNISSALIISLAAWGLILLTDDILQWVALSIGVYAAFSWAQGLMVRDPVVFGMIFKCKTLLSMIFAAGPGVFVGVALPFWAVSYFQRYHGESPAAVGTVLGVGAALMGFSGMLLGGVLADAWYCHNRKGKIYVWLGGMGASVLSSLLFLAAEETFLAYAGIFLLLFSGAMASSPFLSTVNDLALPRGRATVSAFALMVSTFIGVALGPYTIGVMSDAFTATGLSSGEALRQAMLWSLFLPLVGILLALYALKHIEADHVSIAERARALGEHI